MSTTAETVLVFELAAIALAILGHGAERAAVVRGMALGLALGGLVGLMVVGP